MLSSLAVVLEQPKRVALERLPLDEPTAGDVTVETLWSGVSAGTERLLFTGRMPAFPGMGYPLVPGYESVGTVVEAGPDAGIAIGTQVFVPGAKCFGDSVRVRAWRRRLASGRPGLPRRPGPGRTWRERRAAGSGGDRPARARAALRSKAFSLSATASSAACWRGSSSPREASLRSYGKPTAFGRRGAVGYEVTSSDADARKDYRTIFDVSGDPAILDPLVQRLAPGGEIVLAGFYDRLSFSFPPAFMREARIRVAAIWRDGDLAEIVKLRRGGNAFA